jgi:hypothetical protein
MGLENHRLQERRSHPAMSFEICTVDFVEFRV